MSAIDATTFAPLDGIGSRLLPVLGGRAAITAHANGVTGLLVARLLGLRPGTTAIGVLTIDHVAEQHAGRSVESERWRREFGGTSWSSTLTPDASARSGDDALIERVGPLTLRFDVALDAAWGTQMLLRSVRLGRLPLPVGDRWGVTACIGADATTDITVCVPGGSFGYRVDFRRAQ